MVMYEKDGQKFFDKQLLSHILNNEHDKVLSILENVDVKNLVDSSGMTLLHFAIIGNSMTVKYLIDRGCEVNAVDILGDTPLLIAIRLHRNSLLMKIKVIPVLLESNADILFYGQDKRNALEMVLEPENGYEEETWIMFFEVLKRNCSSDRREMAKILVNNKCSLTQAILLKDPTLTEYMLDAGCNINIHQTHMMSLGLTALHIAIQNMDIDNVKLLLERGADIHAEGCCGLKPSFFYRAYEDTSYDMLKILLNYDTALNPSTAHGYQIAGHVLKHGHLNVVELLLNRHNFDFAVSNLNSNNSTLLQDIMENRNYGVLQILEGRKFDVNKRDEKGRTALWNVAMACNPRGLEFLFKHGANLNYIDKYGQSALVSGFEKWTSEEDNIEEYLKCLELFLEHDADAFIFFKNQKSRKIFDVALKRKNFALAIPIIAHVVFMEATHQFIEDDVLQVLKNEPYKKFFNICRQKMKKLKKRMINETVALLNSNA